MSEKRRQLEQAKKIDHDDLDGEVIRMPDHLYDAGLFVSEAVSKRDYLKSEVERVDAELSLKHRKRLERLNEKVSDARIRQHVVTDEDHIKISEEYLDSKKESDDATSLKDAIQNKQFMLKELIKLHLENYSSDTSLKGGSDYEEVKYRANRKRMASKRRGRDRDV